MTAAPPLEEIGGWPAILGSLMAGKDLTGSQAQSALAEILGGGATPAQTAALIVGLRIKGETVEEMAGLVRAMLDAGVAVELPEGMEAVDTCGTGGAAVRREGAFNVSTAAGLVIAGAGVPVCKHGNRLATATSGSADVLEALGVAYDLGAEGVARCVKEAGMGFCFAPRFHPAMRHAGPVRRELGVPTVLNFLGPLANPARVRRQVLGVSDPRLAERMLGVLSANGSERVLVVFGHDGLDELTTTTTSTVLELSEGAVKSWDVDPSELHIDRASPAQLRGGDAEANAGLVRRVLAGERGPHRDLVLLNAAAGLVASGTVEGLREGFEAAMASVDGGQAAAVLDRFERVSEKSRQEP